jgi:hypothetical protein
VLLNEQPYGLLIPQFNYSNAARYDIRLRQIFSMHHLAKRLQSALMQPLRESRQPSTYPFSPSDGGYRLDSEA